MDKKEFKKLLKECIDNGEVEFKIHKNLFNKNEIRVHIDGELCDLNRPDGYYEEYHRQLYGM